MHHDMTVVQPEEILSNLLARIKRLFKHPDIPSDGLLYWRERIVFAIYTVFVLLGFFVYIPSAYQAVHDREWWIFVIDTVGYGSAVTIYLSQRPSFLFRAISLLVIFYVIGIALLFSVNAGYALIWLFAFAVVTAVLLGLNGSCVALAVNFVTLLAAGSLISKSVVIWDPLSPDPVTGWFIVSFNFMFLNSVGSVSIAVLVEKLKRTLEQEQQVSRHLLEQHRLLEQEIEQRKNAEQEKRQMGKKLQQAQKMEAIGTLAGGIAHDFNNLLQAIIGFTTIAQFNLPEKSESRENLNNVLTAGNRAKELIAQILAFSRQTVSQPVALQAQTIVEEAVKLLRSSIPSTITINQEIDRSCGTIMADPTQFQQVIMNLCTNAFQAMETTGGTLTLVLQTTTLTGKEAAGGLYLSPGPYVLLQVTDTGPGIPPSVQEHIFEPYFTTKPVGKGTGMGLAMVHGIVTSHGGGVHCDSSPGRGTTFNLYFPQVLPPDAEQGRDDKDLVLTGTERILFVDDEGLLAEMGGKFLEWLGYSVTTSTDSLSALELFQANPSAFELVITDQTMPGMTGDELARRILSVRSDIPIILCTGYSSSMSPETAESIGIKAYFNKPVTLPELARLIRKTLASH